MTRLSADLLPSLTAITQPQYSRDQVKSSIVHIGIGAFHRAHQAYYTEQVMNTLGGDWGIIGCSLRSANVQEQMAPQQGLYTLLVKGEHSSAQVIGAIKEVLVGLANPQLVIDAIAASQTQIVSLTITEKGYCHNPATGELNLAHPDIQFDLSHLNSPRTAVGYIVAGLQKRMQNSLAGLSVMSCDNLPHNGQVTQQVVLAFAKQVDDTLWQWIVDNVTFPGTMIDRIVPATTAEDIRSFEEQYGYRDLALVCAEPFSQWVIEDNFCTERPRWETVGAILVDDVSAYEKMKLRLLNGTHSLLAYVGFLSGYGTIFQTMQDFELRELAHRFMQAASSTLSMPKGFSVEDYQQQLLDRFANPGLQHRTWQIAMDGSQKVPQRWLNTLRDLIRDHQNTDLFCLALAAWMRYSLGVDEYDQAIELSDPLAEELKRIAQQNQDEWQNYVLAFFEEKIIFGEDFVKNQIIVDSTANFLQSIYQNGMAHTFKQFLKNI